MGTLSEQVENALLEDEQDRNVGDFGEFEKRVSQVTLLLSLIPVLTIPTLRYVFKRSLGTILLVIVFLFCALFYMIQFRFQYIVGLTEFWQSILTKLVVYHPTRSFTTLLDEIESMEHTYERRRVHILYAKPHFRYRDNKWETKQVVSTVAVYHDNLWFRFVHSKETPYDCWSYTTHCKFLNAVGNYRDSYTCQQRDSIRLDPQACIYTFRDDCGGFRLVFEWEYLPFNDEPFNPELNAKSAIELLEGLSSYREIYRLMENYEPPPDYKLDDTMVRKPVVCIKTPPVESDSFLVAHKIDGVFGLVFSGRDYIQEKWEGHERYNKKNVSLGDGIVFSAEKCGPTRVLLDVYQVRGVPTASWSREAILLQFLPTLANKVPGYEIQRYVRGDATQLPAPSLPTDGLVFHDVSKDKVYKLKTAHTLDVVFHADGWFLLPNRKRFKCSEQLAPGRVYEVSMVDGSVVRRREDRFTGNTADQVEKLFECSEWGGPKIESIPDVPDTKRRRTSKAK